MFILHGRTFRCLLYSYGGIKRRKELYFLAEHQNSDFV